MSVQDQATSWDRQVFFRKQWKHITKSNAYTTVTGDSLCQASIVHGAREDYLNQHILDTSSSSKTKATKTQISE